MASGAGIYEVETDSSLGGNRGSSVVQLSRRHWQAERDTLHPFSSLALGPKQEGCALSNLPDSASITLSRGRSAMVDPADLEVLNQWKWLCFPSRGGHFYAGRWIGSRADKQLMFMHRFLMGAEANQRVRHLSGNGLDNRRLNLSLHTLTSTAEERAKNRLYNEARKARIVSGQYVPVHIHRLTDIDTANRTAVCANCGPVTVLIHRTRKKAGNEAIQFRCSLGKNDGAWKARQRKSGRDIGWITSNYQKYKGDRCERCGFVPVHPIQLDVHHRDHDHSNNRRPNLETVCSNCHRLDHLPRWASSVGEAA